MTEEELLKMSGYYKDYWIPEIKQDRRKAIIEDILNDDKENINIDDTDR